MDDDCCGRICICQTVIHERDIKSSNEDLRERIQVFDQQNRSPSLQSFPASTSLAMTTVDSIQQENAEAEMPKTCKRRW
jgi:cell division septum initiation protein DivIVA